jgi:hypothetical protein
MANTAAVVVDGSTTKAHQRVIREQRQLSEPRPAIADLGGCWVGPISRDAAKEIILAYEWLGDMGRAVACYGLHSAGGEVIGAAVFGWPSSPESRDVCGRENRELAVALERGACIHYAPPNAASFLISRAVKLAAADHGWRIFFAYADPAAGELGVVYQACNWLYLGAGVGRTPDRWRVDWLIPEEDTKIIASRTLRHRGIKIAEAQEKGWVPVYQNPKHKYVHFEGNRRERPALLAALRFDRKPYPKRPNEA